MNGTIAGSGGVTKLGLGTLELGGNNAQDNAYTGATDIQAGTLIVTGDNTNLASNATIHFGGTLQLGDGSNNGTVDANIVNDGILVFKEASDLEYGYDISGDGALWQDGNYMLTLSGSNSYLGGTIVKNGRLLSTKPSALPANYILVKDNGNIYTPVSETTLAIVGNIESGYSSIDLLELLQSVSFEDHTNLGIKVAMNDSFTHYNDIHGNQGLLKFGFGELVLSGENDYSGNTSITEGMLTAIKPESLPGYDTPYKVHVYYPHVETDIISTLTIVGNNDTGNWTADDLDALLGVRLLDQYADPFDLGTNLGIQVDGGKAFTYNTDIGGNEGLDKLGDGTLNLGDLNTNNYFLGDVTIDAGKLIAGGDNVFHVEVDPNAMYQPNLLMNGGILDLNSHNLSIYDLNGTNNAVITDNSIIGGGFLLVDLRPGGGAEDIYSGSFIEGINGKKPSVEIEVCGAAFVIPDPNDPYGGELVTYPNILFLNGSQLEFENFREWGNNSDCGGTIAIEEPSGTASNNNMSVVSMEIAEEFIWNSSGTLSIDNDLKIDDNITNHPHGDGRIYSFYSGTFSTKSGSVELLSASLSIDNGGKLLVSGGTFNVDALLTINVQDGTIELDGAALTDTEKNTGVIGTDNKGIFETETSLFLHNNAQLTFNGGILRRSPISTFTERVIPMCMRTAYH